MASELPDGFVDICTATSKVNAEVNIIGVITDVLPPCKSKGTDWMCSFSIADSTYGSENDGMKVRFFKPMESELPKVQGTGDVIILRSLNIRQWSGMTLGLASWSTSWTVFPANSIPEKASPDLQLKYTKDARAPAPSALDFKNAILLCNSRDRNSFIRVTNTDSHTPEISSIQSPLPAQAVPTISRQEKFSLIKDVQIDQFYDLVGQVIKIYPSNGCVELYFTDYTPNPLLYNYKWGLPDELDGISREGDEFGYVPSTSTNKKWPGPFGKLTLTVTLWPSHSYFAQTNVKEKDFVFLRNVRIRYSRDEKVEGSMHTDQRYPDRVDVTILKDHKDDERVKNVLRRKLEYSEKFETQSEIFIKGARSQKRKQDEREKPLSSKQAKRKRKQQKEQPSKSKSKPQVQENPKKDEDKAVEAKSLLNPHKQELNKNSG